jgi:hypothetical protein
MEKDKLPGIYTDAARQVLYVPIEVVPIIAPLHVNELLAVSIALAPLQAMPSLSYRDNAPGYAPARRNLPWVDHNYPLPRPVAFLEVVITAQHHNILAPQADELASKIEWISRSSARQKENYVVAQPVGSLQPPQQPDEVGKPAGGRPGQQGKLVQEYKAYVRVVLSASKRAFALPTLLTVAQLGVSAPARLAPQHRGAYQDVR